MKKITRRTVLKGLGTAVALPFLEAMLPNVGLAAPEAKAAPRRMAFFYVPNGVNMAEWKPTAEGADFKLPGTLEALKDVQKDVTVLSGLTADKARPNGDGPGDHARAMSAFLTGAQPRKTSGADIRVGISVDQFAAQKVGKVTKFPSLELGCEGGRQAGNCDSGYSCAYSSSISWKSESTPMVKEINPRELFDRLFSNGIKNETAEARAKREREELSILDFVLEDARRLKGQLGGTDQRKLEEYLDGVRELEVRIAKASDKADLKGPGDMPRPTRMPDDYKEHIRLLLDMLALALQGDLTRIATFVFANEGSNRKYSFLGVPEGHHDLSHHQRDKTKLEKLAKINRFHMEQFAYFLTKLKSIKEGDGTLLDNCMLLYGSGNGDGDRHNHDDLPILLAGRGGGTIDPGRHVAYRRNTPITNLYLEMLDRMGVQAEKFGDSTGRLPGLTK